MLCLDLSPPLLYLILLSVQMASPYEAETESIEMNVVSVTGGSKLMVIRFKDANRIPVRVAEEKRNLFRELGVADDPDKYDMIICASGGERLMQEADLVLGYRLDLQTPGAFIAFRLKQAG